MKIETDDWVSLPDAAKAAGVSLSTAHRIVKSLGLALEFFGVRIVRRKDVQTIQDNRKPIGNPDWITSHEAASEAAVRAVESRMRRVKRSGLTDAEKRRIEALRTGAAKR